MLPVTGKGAHNDTSKGISWNFRESFLTMTMSHVIVPCLWRSFYFWLRRLSTGEECWMIASIRILVWRRECRRNMLIRHWHFLFPPTTEIHTLKIYITLYMTYSLDWQAHNIGNPRKRITDTRRSELFDTLSTTPKWGWGGESDC